MGAQFDDLKGRAKEATADLTDDPDLKREGQADRAGARVKESLEGLKDKGEDLVDKAKKKLSGRDT
jgi:uncharacterized protein YjbJ (UPF0337 family)